MFNIVKSIRKRYRWALIAIALLISVSALLMQYVFSVQKYDAKIINIAGKQRMLSQKIAWHSNALINQTANKEQHLKSLAHSLGLFEQGHTFLLTKNKQGEAIYLNAALVDLYYAAPGNLDAEVSSFIKQAKKLLTQQEQANPVMFSVGEIEALLKKLDTAVSLFEQQAVTKVNWVANIELLCWFLTLALLLLELRFVFMPMERQVLQTLLEYQQQKEFAEQVSQNKEHFIARASHEFRTPLQGLISSINELSIPSSQQQIQRQAQYCSVRLLAMLDELQDLQALSLNRWSLKPTSDNLLTTLNKILAVYQYGCTEKGLKLITELAPNLDCAVIVDHARLQQIVSELLNNALKFTEQGEVTVIATLNNHQLELSIKDSGCGFSHQIDQLELNNNQQSNHFQGLRTGLTRVQYIVNALNGDIRFENNHPQGAIVFLSLPLEMDTSETKPTRLPDDLKCLVVEDNPLNMLVLTKLLSSLNIQVESAENGKVACEMAAENSYDVIFMDLNMPVLDGFEATKLLHEKDKTRPIIVVTANTSDSDIARAKACGAISHIHKPIDQQSIIAALNDALLTEVD
ncbi:Signal transduction histidine kinase [Pseudoalteromonas sp. 3J6]|uniref:response regulator n=1 Tax=Pseudoalteromonas sp. 3J6 TaxID=649161 RepID=UPI00175A1AED|nr:response regulator [Pseudoalteromonas sp. 3J6]CAD2223209.1 Signal transduction histidine kinase [Pseudoalteromonas sp. 3J6]